jgi:hypothetical protein
MFVVNQRYRWKCCGCKKVVRAEKPPCRVGPTVCPDCGHVPCAGCKMLNPRAPGRPKKKVTPKKKASKKKAPKKLPLEERLPRKARGLTFW